METKVVHSKAPSPESRKRKPETEKILKNISEIDTEIASSAESQKCKREIVNIPTKKIKRETEASPDKVPSPGPQKWDLEFAKIPKKIKVEERDTEIVADIIPLPKPRELEGERVPKKIKCEELEAEVAPQHVPSPELQKLETFDVPRKKRKQPDPSATILNFSDPAHLDMKMKNATEKVKIPKPKKGPCLKLVSTSTGNAQNHPLPDWPPNTFTSKPRTLIFTYGSMSVEKTDDDPWGRRKAGLFALKESCIFKMNWFLPTKVFPAAKQHETTRAHSFFGNITIRNQHKEHCNKGRHKIIDGTRFDREWSQDRAFATIPLGSIVVMTLLNSGRKGEVCFGMVRPINLQMRRNFGIEKLKEIRGDISGRYWAGEDDSTFLFQRVQWMFWAKLEDLPVAQDSNKTDRDGFFFPKWIIDPRNITPGYVQGQQQNVSVSSGEFCKWSHSENAFLLTLVDY